MFNNLRDFKYVRNKKEAFGFYLAYVALGFVIVVIIGGVMGGAGLLGDTVEEAQEKGKYVGWTVAPIYSMALAYMVGHAKNLKGAKKYIFAIVGGAFGMFSAFVGVAVAAYVTTQAFYTKDYP